TTKPDFLMPPAVAIPAPEPGLKRADLGLPNDKFVFYFNFDFRSYVGPKNPVATLAAVRRAFPRPDASACLLLNALDSTCRPRWPRPPDRAGTRPPWGPAHPGRSRRTAGDWFAGLDGSLRFAASLGGIRGRPRGGAPRRQAGHRDRLSRPPRFRELRARGSH